MLGLAALGEPWCLQHAVGSKGPERTSPAQYTTESEKALARMRSSQSVGMGGGRGGILGCRAEESSFLNKQLSGW